MLYLPYIHGIYNALIISLFVHQGWLGLKIRRERIQGKPPTVRIIKRHRKLGPVLVPLGVLGYLAGPIFLYLRRGNILEYPLHFINGSVIVLMIIATFFISKKIKSRESPWRTPHLAAGVCIIALYLLQAFFGIGILF
ncbi:MAG: DUF4079 domain-containing protein [Nitrospirota bacterium]